MASLLETSSQDCVLIRDTNGIVAIPRSSPLTRLHYFDGKFLRAEHLSLEQDYQRRLVEVSNQAGGAGVVYGLDCTLTGGDQLEVGSGMAIDPQGQVILLPQNQRLSLTELIARSRRQLIPLHAEIGSAKAQFGECELRERATPGIVQDSTDFYVITVGHAEAYCGTEDVYGKLCEEACVTSTSRPYVVEGVVFRAEPVPELWALLPASRTPTLTATHLRSRVASAYFQRDDQAIIAAGAPPVLGTRTPCSGARLPGGENVPIALVARQGSTTLFLDAWIARRERMEAPARTYWAGCLRLRPWHLFLAQVLQFQCHLSELFQDGKELTVVKDPRREAQGQMVGVLEGLIQRYPKVVELLGTTFPKEQLLPDLGVMQTLVGHLRTLEPVVFGSTDQALIQGGIVELPSAGYLPVDAKSTRTVNEQVRRLLGGGLDLRFCVVRPDYIPHALEEAQHMERISLTQGLDDPKKKPEVDVLVPNGTIRKYQAVPRGTGFVGDVSLKMKEKTAGIHGAGRAEERDSGGLEFYFGGTGTIVSSSPDRLAAVTELGRVAFPAAGVRVAEVGIASVASARPATRVATDTMAQPNLSMVSAAPLRVADSDVRPATRVATDTMAQPDLSIASAMPSLISDLDLRPLLPKLGLALALWFELRFDRNPFALATGDTTDASLRWLWTWPGAEAGPVELHKRQFAATLVIHSVTESTVTGRFNIGWSHPELGIVTATRGRLPISSFTIRREREKGALVYTLTVPSLGLTLSANVTAAEKWGKAVFDPSGNSSMEFDTKLQVDPTVFSAEHPAHQSALLALDKLGDELKDEPDFADTAARRLFPPLLPQPAELQVLATQDWVLFHRRRHKECEVEPVAPVPPVAREYKVFLARTDEEGLKRVMDALQVGNVGGLTEPKLEPIGCVTFAPGAAELASAVKDIQDRWLLASPGNKLLYGAIASTAAAAAEGDPLAKLRLRTLVEVLPLVAAWDAPPEVLAEVPTGLGLEDKDGVCILVTNKTTCLSVYALGSDKELGRVTALLERGDLGPAKDCGQVHFWGETDDVAANSLTEVLTKLKGYLEQGKPAAKYVVVSEQDASAEHDQERAAIIYRKLDESGDVQVIRVTAKLPNVIPCRRAAVFFARPSAAPEPTATTCMAVYPVDAATMKELQTVISHASLPSRIVEVLARVVGQPPIGTVDFYENNEAVGGSLEKLVQQWGTLSAGVGVAVAVSKEEQHANEDHRRVLAIYRGLGGQATSSVGAPVVIGPLDAIPCRAALFAVRPQARAVRAFVRDTAPDGTARLVPIEAPVTLRPDGTLDAGFAESVRGPLEGRVVTEMIVAPRETGIDPQARERAMNDVKGVLAREKLIPEGQEVRADVKELTTLERDLLPADIDPAAEVIVFRTRKR